MRPSPPRERPSRVLFVSGRQIHPPLGGGHLRSLALAEALRRREQEVFVYSMAGRRADYLRLRPSSIVEWPGGVPEYVNRRLPGFLAQYSSQALGLPPIWLTAGLSLAVAIPPLLPHLLRERLAWCDVVMADFPFVHPVFEAPCARGRVRVLSTHNVEHHLLADTGRWQGRWLRSTVRRIELTAAARSDILVSCCQGDQQFFEANVRLRRSIVVPNGIDLRRFRGIERHRDGTRHSLGVADDERLFLFTASRYGPNREAFDYLLGFATSASALLREQRIHLLVVGDVVRQPVRLPGFTALGRVQAAEPYFAAADAALNPISTGAGTNVKMGEFIAVRLPIVTTRFGARGFEVEHGRTGFVFEREGLAEALSMVRRLSDEAPDRLREIAERAYLENRHVIDMDLCIAPLLEALDHAPGSAGHEGLGQAGA